MQGSRFAENMVRSGDVDIINPWTLVAALVRRQEFEGVMGDSHVGIQGEMMSLL